MRIFLILLLTQLILSSCVSVSSKEARIYTGKDFQGEGIYLTNISDAKNGDEPEIELKPKNRVLQLIVEVANGYEKDIFFSDLKETLFTTTDSRFYDKDGKLLNIPSGGGIGFGRFGSSPYMGLHGKKQIDPKGKLNSCVCCSQYAQEFSIKLTNDPSKQRDFAFLYFPPNTSFLTFVLDIHVNYYILGDDRLYKGLFPVRIRVSDLKK